MGPQRSLNSGFEVNDRRQHWPRAPRGKSRVDVIICRAVEAGQQVASHLRLTLSAATGNVPALTARWAQLNKATHRRDCNRCRSSP